MSEGGEEVSNKQILLRDYVTGFPKESDMVLKTGTIQLKVPKGSKSIVVKNLYLSCDPRMRIKMTKLDVSSNYFDFFTPGSVLSLSLSHTHTTSFNLSMFYLLHALEFDCTPVRVIYTVKYFNFKRSNHMSGFYPSNQFLLLMSLL